MRDIKFRGKQINNGEWVYGDFVHHDGITDIHFQTGDGEAHFISVDPETVGQFTGLSDKNGKEIYEGDICEAWSQGTKGIGEIKRRIDGLWIFYPAWQLNEFWGLMPSANGGTDVEIIGNVHDNPELMEGDNGRS